MYSYDWYSLYIAKNFCIEEIQANSQPIGESGAPSVELAYSLTHSQPLDSDNLPLSVQSPPQPLASGYSPLS